MMKKALGEWPGGPKPSPFGCVEDTQEPSVRFLTPSAGRARWGTTSPVKVDVRDDCDVEKVEITVMPQGLSAIAKAPPYEWELTGINGAQTITVTATDAQRADRPRHPGRHRARERAASSDRATTTSAGCNVASGGFGAAGLVPSLAMLLLFASHNRRSRRRKRPRRAVAASDGPSP